MYTNTHSDYFAADPKARVQKWDEKSDAAEECMVMNTYDAIAELCLDALPNEIDKRLLREMERNGLLRALSCYPDSGIQHSNGNGTKIMKRRKKSYRTHSGKYGGMSDSASSPVCNKSEFPFVTPRSCRHVAVNVDERDALRKREGMYQIDNSNSKHSENLPELEEVFSEAELYFSPKNSQTPKAKKPWLDASNRLNNESMTCYRGKNYKCDTSWSDLDKSNERLQRFTLQSLPEIATRFEQNENALNGIYRIAEDEISKLGKKCKEKKKPKPYAKPQKNPDNIQELNDSPYCESYIIKPDKPVKKIVEEGREAGFLVIERITQCSRKNQRHLERIRRENLNRVPLSEVTENIAHSLSSVDTRSWKGQHTISKEVYLNDKDTGFIELNKVEEKQESVQQDFAFNCKDNLKAEIVEKLKPPVSEVCTWREVYTHNTDTLDDIKKRKKKNESGVVISELQSLNLTGFFYTMFTPKAPSVNPKQGAKQSSSYFGKSLLESNNNSAANTSDVTGAVLSAAETKKKSLATIMSRLQTKTSSHNESARQHGTRAATKGVIKSGKYDDALFKKQILALREYIDQLNISKYTAPDIQASTVQSTKHDNESDLDKESDNNRLKPPENIPSKHAKSGMLRKIYKAITVPTKLRAAQSKAQEEKEVVNFISKPQSLGPTNTLDKIQNSLYPLTGSKEKRVIEDPNDTRSSENSIIESSVQESIQHYQVSDGLPVNMNTKHMKSQSRSLLYSQAADRHRAESKDVKGLGVKERLEASKARSIAPRKENALPRNILQDLTTSFVPLTNFEENEDVPLTGMLNRVRERDRMEDCQKLDRLKAEESICMRPRRPCPPKSPKVPTKPCVSPCGPAPKINCPTISPPCPPVPPSPPGCRPPMCPDPPLRRRAPPCLPPCKAPSGPPTPPICPGPPIDCPPPVLTPPCPMLKLPHSPTPVPCSEKPPPAKKYQCPPVKPICEPNQPPGCKPDCPPPPPPPLSFPPPPCPCTPEPCKQPSSTPPSGSPQKPK